jgi:uncharacterized protein
MLKPRGAICDLDCAYCYYLSKEKLYPGSDFLMDEAVLESFTRQYIQAQPAPEVVFEWQGGEPLLMGLEFFKRAIALQRKYERPGMRTVNTIQTNGLHLDDEWCRFFKEHEFLIGISLDGPAQLHDAYRVDKGGRPTFEGVLKGLQLLQQHGVEYNVLTTVHAANAGHPLEVYRFLRDEANTRFVQFIPIVQRDNDSGFQEGNHVTNRSVTGRQYGEFLVAIFNEWVQRDVGRVFVQLFDVALAAWVGHPPGLCIFQETCGAALAIEHTGDLYSCDHFVEPRHLLGNVQNTPLVQLVGSREQAAFGEAKRDTLPRYCQACEVRFVCNGGCPKNRILETPDGEPGLNYLCEGYRRFFNHVDPAMRFMANALRAGQPPAGIMREFARRHYGSRA